MRRAQRRYFARSQTAAVCDFCIGPGVQWGYRSNRFIIPEDAEFPMYIDDGKWAACDACMHDIEAARYESIARRLFNNMWADCGPNESVDPGSVRWAARTFAAFLHNKIEGPTPE